MFLVIFNLLCKNLEYENCFFWVLINNDFFNRCSTTGLPNNFSRRKNNSVLYLNIFLLNTSNLIKILFLPINLEINIYLQNKTSVLQN